MEVRTVVSFRRPGCVPSLELTGVAGGTKRLSFTVGNTEAESGEALTVATLVSDPSHHIELCVGFDRGMAV